MSSTQPRDRACRLAPADTDAALRAAQRIRDPRNACQALAWAARFAEDSRVEPIANMALAAARRAADPFDAVSAAAWPIRALVERGRTKRLKALLAPLLRLSEKIEPAASRSEALFLLYEAVFPAGRRWWRALLAPLAAASVPAVHWRQSRNLRDAVLMAARDDPAWAARYVHSVGDPRTRGRIERGLAQQECRTPRAFFRETGGKGRL